jgi:hypothetical protein
MVFKHGKRIGAVLGWSACSVWALLLFIATALVIAVAIVQDIIGVALIIALYPVLYTALPQIPRSD